jgi:hypothetical protein
VAAEGAGRSGKLARARATKGQLGEHTKWSLETDCNDRKRRAIARGGESVHGATGRRKSARKRKLARKSRRVRPTPLERLARAYFHPLVLNAQGMPAGSFGTQSMSMHCASSLWDCPHTIFSIGFVTGGSMRGTTFFTTFSHI